MQIEKEAKAIIMMCAAFVLSKAWTLLPESGELVQPFLVDPGFKIAFRTYVWIACEIVASCIVYYAASTLFVKLRWAIMAMFWLAVLGIPDYLLWYKEPLFYAGSLPVEYDLIKGIGFVLIAAVAYIKWKR